MLVERYHILKLWDMGDSFYWCKILRYFYKNELKHLTNHSEKLARFLAGQDFSMEDITNIVFCAPETNYYINDISAPPPHIRISVIMETKKYKNFFLRMNPANNFPLFNIYSI